MAVKVLIPTPLRSYVGHAASIEVQGGTVGEAMNDLLKRHEGIRKHLFDAQGQLRSFVNLYVNDEDIRHLSRMQTPLKESDTITIIPSVAGGVSLSNSEIRRYSRHLIMPEVGLRGQERLKKAKVLCVGTGGLGSPLAMYLAAAGIGTLGLVDFDVVDESNLQRQIIHGTSDVGKRKVLSAQETIRDINPEVNVVVHETRLSSENALEILLNYDIVADGTDNFPTRYLVNDACVLTGKPNAYGSIFRFEGQASVFCDPKGPCYRCLYPEPPPPGLVPSCAEGGVLGILPGIIGLVQATEVVKLALGIGETLVGRLMLYDALSMRFREMRIRKNPECPVCGENPTIKSLIDYDQFCGIPDQQAREKVEAEFEIEPTELARKLAAGEDVFLLDVRNPDEYAISRIENSELIPLPTLLEGMNRLDSARETAVYCHTGRRSAQAVNFLRGIGFTRVKNLRGGIDAWSREVDPAVPRY
jgi:adenylyltransferase/sulfurtransferase